MSTPEIEPYYKKQAKDLTDLLFDRGFLQPILTRESVNWLEDYIGFVFQSQTQMAVKTALLTANIKKRFARTRGEEEAFEKEKS